MNRSNRPLDLAAYWMPFTANRLFKTAPRLLTSAKDMHYSTDDGRLVLDGTSGMWCVNAGHCRQSIVRAVQSKAAELDYAPPFQIGHPDQFELATRLAALAPPGLDRIFYTNSGSESVETALKMALAYHRLKGEGSRTRLIGRERGYHGVNLGGLSVSGTGRNRKDFGPLLPGVDYLRHTHDLEHNAFSRGLPAWGAHLADDLEHLVELHDASTIAGVIVEPMIGSAGVYPPPQGYLQRLRAICDKYGILLIFDEVITGFGRLGAPFAANLFGVTPDLMTTAKGITNGTVPMGAVFASRKIHDAFMTGPETAVEFMHGYTYSGSPLAVAASMAALDIYESENLLTRATVAGPVLEAALHGLKDLPHVIDLRNFGLAAAIELAPRPGAPGARGRETFIACFEKGVLVRMSGDVIILAPPLIAEKSHIEQIIGTITGVLKKLA